MVVRRRNRFANRISCCYTSLRSGWPCRLSLNCLSPELGSFAIFVFAYDIGVLAMTFDYAFFMSQDGIEFWLLNAMLFSRGGQPNTDAMPREARADRGDPDALRLTVRNPYLLVTGDFVKTGAMDRANFALAHHLATRGFETHLVAHRVDRDLAESPNIVVHRVPRPAGSHLLGAPLLIALGASGRGGFRREVAVSSSNGGSCHMRAMSTGSTMFMRHIAVALSATLRAT